MQVSFWEHLAMDIFLHVVGMFVIGVNHQAWCKFSNLSVMISGTFCV